MTKCCFILIWFQLQPDDNLMLNEWEKILNEARERFKENSTVVVSFNNKEKVGDDTMTMEDELYKVR